MRNVSPVFILVTNLGVLKQLVFGHVSVENVFCKVAAPHRYIGNILDQHVNVMQKYLEVAPNRRVQVVNAERSISSEPKAQR